MTAYRPAWLRWLVPAGAVLAVTVGAAALTTSASAEPRLPARTAAQLLVDVQTARVDGLSGMVTQRADLGLPSLPGQGGRGSADLTSLITGTHTLRVWYSGPNSARVALLGTLGESDVITNGRDVWMWSSRDNTATHRTLPAQSAQKPRLDPADLPKTPQEAADAALAAIDPSTAVTTADPTKVAGRAAYELVLAPRDADSLIAQVRVAIDAVKHVPLRVQVYADGVADPAIEVAFTQVSFARPSAEQFRFNPPPGAKIVEEKAEAPSQGAQAAGKPRTAVIGDGWTSVLVARVDRPASSGGNELSGLLQRLPAVHGSWGSGRLLSGNLFSVLLTDDGRTLAGAVRADRLYEVAADPAAALK